MNRIGIEGPLSPPTIAPDGRQSTDAKEPFADVLDEALSNVRSALYTADRAAADALVGQAAPHSAMLAIAKADLQFRMLTQTRNKLVGAYNELMNLRM